MTIVEKLNSLMDFQARRYVVFVLSYQDAEELRGTLRIQPPPEERWTFHGVPVLVADVHKSYAIEEDYELPTFHML